jgi:phage portal protein BeeE
MGIASRIAQPLIEQRSLGQPLSLDEYVSLLSTFGGMGLNTTIKNDVEEIDGSFTSLVTNAYKTNGIVFTCILTRQLILSEARFQFRQLRDGETGDLFGTPDLGILEKPWKGATTGDLLTRISQYADLAGNAFVVKRARHLTVPKPHWVTILLGSPNDSEVVADDLDAEVIGYLYHPGGRFSGRPPVSLLPEFVAHYAPIPDPMASYRGMSWLTAMLNEVMADSATTEHKLNFFRNGATANMVVSIPETARLTPQTYREWVEAFDQEHKGVTNAYKTLYLAGGAAATVVGADMKQLDFKLTQGAGETRIAAASGMHPVILALSEGMQGSSLNAGNFNQAKRLTADKALRPAWRNICGSLESIVPPPPGSQLWYDFKDIPFLAEDVKDAAEVQQKRSETINRLITAGYKPDAVIDAVESEDLARLKGQHTGLFSVQLQPPTTVVPAANGSSNGKPAVPVPVGETSP